MTFRPAQLAFIRLLIIPVGCSLGVGWSAYENQDWWGQYLLGAGVLGVMVLMPFLWKRRW